MLCSNVKCKKNTGFVTTVFDSGKIKGLCDDCVVEGIKNNEINYSNGKFYTINKKKEKVKDE